MPAQVSGDREPARLSENERASSKAAALIVERVTHADVPEICNLYKRVWEGYRDKLADELIKAWEPSPLEFTSWMEGVTYFVARRDHKVVGAIGCEISDGSCRLVHLAVDPEARRQGAAQALTNAATEWARHNTVNSVWADALARFTEARGLFLGLGFTECGVLHRHYWREDVILFEKIL